MNTNKGVAKFVIGNDLICHIFNTYINTEVFNSFF
jgi:hypothetical protein